MLRSLHTPVPLGQHGGTHRGSNQGCPFWEVQVHLLMGTELLEPS